MHRMEEIMKKIRTLLLVSLMTLSIAMLTACGRKNDNAADNGNDSTTTTESGTNAGTNDTGTGTGNTTSTGSTTNGSSQDITDDNSTGGINTMITSTT